VWLALQQVGRDGYVQMISDDIRLARELFERILRVIRNLKHLLIR
jgi:glutamate/tyrosine decarboxylase-like PLP-dependent enzyme